MRVLVTGADGFVGGHLIAELRRRSHEIVAALQRPNPGFDVPIEIRYFELTDPQSVEALIQTVRPDGIIHLAAQSSVPQSWQNPAQTFLVNTIGTVNLIDAIRKHVPEAMVVIVGSGEEYGLTGRTGRALTEEDPCLPQNPYATSKLAAGQAALQLAKKHNLHIVHVRPFNHFGPGQLQGFVISDFASQIARIENGAMPGRMKVGDLSPKRDFLDVRDVVVAYAELLEHRVNCRILNICSGMPRSIREILDILVSQATVPIQIDVDADRLRPSEVPVYIGSAEKIGQEVGWRPMRAFQESLAETLQWWRRKPSE